MRILACNINSLLSVYDLSAPSDKSRINISSETSFKLLHSLRRCHDGVLIGINTLLSDKPRLNVREVLDIQYEANDVNHSNHSHVRDCHQQQPRAIILDSKLSIINYNDDLLVTRPIVVTSLTKFDSRVGIVSKALEKIGGEIIHCNADSTGRLNIKY